MSFASDGEGSGKAPKQALTGSLREYRVLPGTDLVGRVEPFFAWQDLHLPRSSAVALCQIDGHRPQDPLHGADPFRQGLSRASTCLAGLPEPFLPSRGEARRHACDRGIRRAQCRLGRPARQHQAFARVGAGDLGLPARSRDHPLSNRLVRRLCRRARLRAPQRSRRDGRAGSLLPAGRRARSHAEHPLSRAPQRPRPRPPPAEDPQHRHHQRHPGRHGESILHALRHARHPCAACRLRRIQCRAARRLRP